MKAQEKILALRDHLALARHPQRPYLLDYASRLFNDFLEIHGDRYIADDPAMVCGIARFQRSSLLLTPAGPIRGSNRKSAGSRRPLPATCVRCPGCACRSLLRSSLKEASVILWRDQEHVGEAAKSLRLTARELKELGVIDEIVAEPNDGAHTDHTEAARLLDQSLITALNEIRSWTAEGRMQKRYEKFRAIGSVQKLTDQHRLELKANG